MILKNIKIKKPVVGPMPSPAIRSTQHCASPRAQVSVVTADTLSQYSRVALSILTWSSPRRCRSQQIADIVTKDLTKAMFEEFRSSLCLDDDAQTAGVSKWLITLCCTG